MRALVLGVAVLLVTTTASGEGVAPAPPAGQGQLHADHVRYDVKTRALAADGNVILAIGDTEVRADRLTFEPDAQRVRAAGRAMLTHGESVVQAPDLTFDIGSDVMEAHGGVRLVERDGTLTGEAILANLRTRDAEVTGHATLVRAGGRGHSAGDAEQIVIAAPRIMLHADPREARADGGVVVTQGDRGARAQRLVYSGASGRMELDGQVVATQSNAPAPARATAPAGATTSSGTPPRPGASPTMAASPSLLTVTCDRLTILLAERDMQANGNVTVSHKGRSAIGDRADYTEQDRHVIVTGNARMLDSDGNRLRADRVTISLADDVFEASGNVDTEFRVTRTDRRPAPAHAP